MRKLGTGMASATLKPYMSRTLGAREFILSTAIEVGVVYHRTRNDTLLVSGHGSIYDQILAGKIGLKFVTTQC